MERVVKVESLKIDISVDGLVYILNHQNWSQNAFIKDTMMVVMMMKN